MKKKSITHSNEIPKITFDEVSFSWPGKKEKIIYKCNFSIEKPGLWMIVGKNGSGKSTFLKLINGILKPTSGTVKCQAKVGMVFQNPDHQILMPNCWSELLININQNINHLEIRRKIEAALFKVGLPHFEKMPIHSLSGGQKQRLAIASSLVSDKNFILMDEPTALLDKNNQLQILKTIKYLASDKNNPFTALWITHRLEELSFADGIAEMKNGNLSDWYKPSKFQNK